MALVEAEEAGDRLNKSELLGTVFLLLVSGSETTTHLLTGGLLTLMNYPEQMGRVIVDWSKGELRVSSYGSDFDNGYKDLLEGPRT